MRDKTTAKKPEVNVKLDKPGGTSEWKPIGGSNSDQVNAWLSDLAVNALNLPPDDRERISSACLQTMVGLNPRDEIEGMICAQLVATNAAALEAMRRGFHPDQFLHARMDWLNIANKMMRTHAALSETLIRKRTGGQQRIIVEKVQVAPGGQAVLGDVHNSLGGGRAHEKVNQSHEHATEAGRLTAASEPALQGAIETDQAKMRSPSRTG